MLKFSIVRSLFFAIGMMLVSTASFAQIGIAISIAPPALPVYEQPICPGDGYIWTPGYWAYGDDGYYWVPGTWVVAPEVGFLWTPPYWGWGNGGYMFYDGFWGPTIGFYGGINYGFGYFGVGFEGGRWDNGRFFYNRSITNIDVTVIHNVYNTTVINNNVNRVSFNGGNGGVIAHPTPMEEAARNGRHVPPVAAQVQHEQAARSNPDLRASSNHGNPPIAATARPGDFHTGAVPAKAAGAPYQGDHATDTGSRATPAAIHPKDLPASEHAPLPNTGNKKLDSQYLKQQEKLESQQNNERMKLQQQQDKEHAQLAKKNADTAAVQKVEQKHQQQTQSLQQKHTQQQQDLQTRQQPASRPESKPR